VSVQPESSPSGILPIAVDAMGGDLGPKVVVEGAVQAAQRSGIPCILVGDEAQLAPLLSSHPGAASIPVSIKHASQVVGMDEAPGLAIRKKPDASIRVAFELVADRKASAVVSAGNTGAIMAAGVFVGGTLPGIARPAIASLIPKAVGGTPTVLLDSGANTGCQAFQLVQFALMGHQYALAALGVPKPRIALLSNGTEMSKGNDIIRSAAMMLSEIEGINFIGYVEGRDVARDVVDVVVCDGFVGNIVLKAMEGSVRLVVDSIKSTMESSLRAKIGLWLAKPVLRTVFKDKLDPSAYGGAPLLGLADVAIKCHGSSSSRAIKNGIKVARTFVEQSVLADLRTALSQLDVKVGEADTESSNGWSKVFEKRSKRENGDEKTPKGVSGVEHDRD
jgi:glycerol-3-phosphate acyltransferase PlsX